MKKILFLLLVIILLGAVVGFLWVSLKNKSAVKNYQINNSNYCNYGDYEGQEAECDILAIEVRLSIGQEGLAELEQIFKDNNAEIINVSDLNALQWRIYKIKVADEKIIQFKNYLKYLGYTVRYADIGQGL